MAILKADFVPALYQHALELAPDMRQDDVAEVAAFGQSPLEALVNSMERSDVSATFIIDGKVAAMCGAASLPGRALLDLPIGVPWLLTGHVVDRHAKTFVQASRSAIEYMLRTYVELRQMIHVEHLRAVRWAAAVGFKVNPAVPWGLRGEPFHPVFIRRAHG